MITLSNNTTWLRVGGYWVATSPAIPPGKLYLTDESEFCVYSMIRTEQDFKLVAQELGYRKEGP